MRNTRFTNTLLGIIAINLSLITLIQLEIFPPKAYASETSQPIKTNYGLVPINEDGSIDVNINSSTATMDVNLMTLRGDLIGKTQVGGGRVAISVNEWD
tara:strand:- start:513 stop:809 length:297 start_codon:yes stop_codon:yes gene_type:complete